jgi:hypothetical protein
MPGDEVLQMRKLLRTVPTAIGASLLLGVAGLAGSFTGNFNTASETGFTLGGEAAIDANRLLLTAAANDKTGSVTFDDLDGGMPIESFTANFKLQIGPGSGNAADGVSLSFGPDVAAGNTYGEDGPNGTALTVAFDIYDNGLGEAPAIDIRLFGNQIAHHPLAKADMVTSKTEDVSIQLKRNGTLTVTYKGAVIHDNVLLPGWAPVNGLFNFSARTGGENAEISLDDLSITTVQAGAAVKPTFTTQPQSVAAAEGGSASFTVAADGTAPLSFQWMKNNVDIADATNQTLVLGAVYYADNNAKIKVAVTNPGGTSTSSEATLTVSKDTVAPTVAKANSDPTSTQITIQFSEPVSDTALTASNYKVDQSVTVSSVARVDEKSVRLTTSVMTQGRSYTLTINGVQDKATTPNTIASNTQVLFRTFVFQVGSLLRKKYNNFDDNAGGTPDNLWNDPRYPNSPDHVDLQLAMEYPPNGNGRDAVADPSRNYFDTLEGFFMPPTTGDYVFLTSGADRVWMYLSTDDQPANRVLIAKINGWTNPRGWNTGQGGTDMTPARSDTFDVTEWPDGNTVKLTSGKRYYMMLLHHDPSWSGGDQFGATYKLASEADPAAGDVSKLSGSVVGTYLDPTGASITFVQQPASVTIVDSLTTTFTGKATAVSAYGTTVVYQWQTAPSGSSTFTDISGATKESYTTPVLRVADSGKQYRLVATVPGMTEFSQVATVTVIVDTIAPKLVSAGAMPSESGATFDVGVTFDEALNAGSAATVANYTLSAGSITAAKYYPGSKGVVLTASGMAVGSTYTVTVANVTDVPGNKMASTSQTFTVSKMKWGVVGGNELGLGNGVVAVGANGFDVHSGGATEWASYDEATFVYEEITGDFDKEVRVEYQDASSQWGRAGLIARDVTNFGVDQATQEGGQAGRYQKVHVNPVLTAMGTAGNNLWEGNRRLQTGGATTGPIAGVNSAPKYPDAWCRLKRVGQTFTIYRSDDGANWIELNSTTWPDPEDTAGSLMPQTLYVGMDYSPENRNVAPASLQAMFVAKYRDYRDHSDVVLPPTLTYTATATGLTITYQGTLQSADAVSGPWTDVQGSSSPYNATASVPKRFYRAKK